MLPPTPFPGSHDNVIDIFVVQTRNEEMLLASSETLMRVRDIPQ